MWGVFYHENIFVVAVFLASLFISLKGSSDCDGSVPIIAKVKQGVMRGKSMTSVRGKQFCAFQGIPYAQPPTGQLRFKPPDPPSPWEDILSATKEGDECVHPAFLLPTARGSEDCLYLNVYTPWLNSSDGMLLDVMVFITPGLFYCLSSSVMLYGPQFLMDKNIVLVTFNYRLGAFGFLSTEDDEAPGNYGMKDQVAALQWVKDNIESLGGNSHSITIFGADAGGASVHYHMISPLTKGLFHRAISMDGTVVMPWARSYKPAELAQKQASLVGCPTSPSNKLVECLRALPLETINRSIYSLFALWFLAGPGYAPVIEKKTERNPLPYLTDDPIQALSTGAVQKIPWIVGGNSNPAALFLAPVLNIKVLRKLLNKYSDVLWPKIMMLPRSLDDTDIPSVMYNISHFYGIDTHFLYPEQDILAIKMVTDRYFAHGIHKAVELHLKAGHSPIYQYNFAYRGLFSWSMATSLNNYGTSLGDEQRFLFETNFNLRALKRYFTFHLPKPSFDKEVQELMLTMWTNFAKYGNPTPPKDERSFDNSDIFKELTWEPNDIGKMKYLNIGQTSSSQPSIFLNQHLGPVELHMAENLNKEYLDFWDLLPLNENVHYEPCKIACDVSVTSGSKQHISVIFVWLLFLQCLISITINSYYF